MYTIVYSIQCWVVYRTLYRLSITELTRFVEVVLKIRPDTGSVDGPHDNIGITVSVRYDLEINYVLVFLTVSYGPSHFAPIWLQSKCCSWIHFQRLFKVNTIWKQNSAKLEVFISTFTFPLWMTMPMDDDEEFQMTFQERNIYWKREFHKKIVSIFRCI